MSELPTDDLVGDAKGIEEGLRFLVPMGPARCGCHAMVRRCSGTDGMQPALGSSAPGTDAVTGIDEVPCRHAHHSQCRPVPLHERDVDGEFAVSAEELLCAVQRIDQPEAFADLL